VIAQVFPDAQTLIAQEPTPEVFCIDIPIGLTEAGPRPCDVEARRILKGRASSVFDAPIRSVLMAATQSEASTIRRRIEGKGVSCQSFAIYPKIREVDEVLRSHPNIQPRVREVHPEVCFWARNQGRAMAHSKKTAEGQAERLALIESHFGAGLVARIRASIPRSSAAMDDILDALVALWTAQRIFAGTAGTLPARPEQDSCQLRMEMVY
jgi:predicted RNase H-like nuclease